MDDLAPISAQERAKRSVFVGNIPYEATEEALKEIFIQAGPVVSFRLVYDRETGKPKGYGFCEYQDVETAQSALRNLNNTDFNGRPLRVGVAAGESNKDEMAGMQQALGGPILESPYGDPVEPEKAPEAISKAVASLPPEQMFELMKQMKLCIQNNPTEARNMLLQNPQLAYALLQAQIVMKIVDPQVAMAMLHRDSSQVPPAGSTAPTPATSQPPVQQAPIVPPQPQTSMPDASMMGGGRGPGGLMGNVPVSQGPGGPAGMMGGPRGPGMMGGPGPQGMGNRPQLFPIQGMGGPGPQNMGGPGPQNMGGPGPQNMGGPGPQGMGGPGPQGMGGPGPQGMGGPGPQGMGGPGQGPPQRPDFGRDPRDPRLMAQGDTRGMPAGPRPVMPPASIASSQGMMQNLMQGGLPNMAGMNPQMLAAGGGGPGVTSQDQEKAALIMQVLQLTDQQIAMLPPDQRQSILILKEQISKNAT
ncbi:cleavage stimulation factor subunit 2-like [Mercenaria mercenaria]|uniref:cleavage stimulation factor subunit 2-like n=1 Tax=Mercenaria mercenaria TaxID=6596 RepID=UPI00234EF549|nr:cleavage stimulation factor subunit 2-like [Mercenaria mercenaria]